MAKLKAFTFHFFAKFVKDLNVVLNIRGAEMEANFFYGFFGNILFAILYAIMSTLVPIPACWIICYFISAFWQFPVFAAGALPDTEFFTWKQVLLYSPVVYAPSICLSPLIYYGLSTWVLSPVLSWFGTLAFTGWLNFLTVASLLYIWQKENKED